ncbi:MULTISPECIES: hypothetical protein [unclassified Pseudomonas]|uniref:hypothetical protein n=3 Tax=Pseudomonas TaxID=286 RepID=UPI0002A30E32|nr:MULTISPECIES: hypothetical protein [unclassified Pseudomonas]MBB1637238.1 hypothetical protein [Pseudomonas sp. UME83]MBB1608547.1 hypothetical protein [Pseudomonas sp. UMC76]NTX90251.1 hypothetical protein [Pseudomonas sp. UMA643]NTY21129.1 hypothetical protein [Pseudomonas sp. UMC3103]NTY27393.1 hypothetical protein [Pseudomonas sp. UMA603]
MSPPSATPLRGMLGLSESAPVSTWLSRVLVFLMLTALIAPFYPRMPSMGLDPSWELGMQEAVANGWLIGQDLVFTFGPYASLFTLQYHPQTDMLSLLSGIGFGFLYSALFLLVCRRLPALLVLLNAALFCWLIVISRDCLLFTYPLLLALALHSLIDDLHRRADLRAVFAVCVAGLGLLPLIKGSLLPLCLCISAFCAWFAWHEKARVSAVTCLVAPPLTALLLWLASGQPASGILAFAHNILPIISGYTSAMATYGENQTILTYISVSTIVLASLLVRRQPWYRTAFVLVAFALFLFLSFKAAFVRVDHVVIALGSLLIAILLASGHMPRPLWLLSAFGGLALAWQVPGYKLLDVEHNLGERYTRAANGIIERLTDPTKLAAAYSAKLQWIHQRDPIAKLPGTSDIYPWDQASLIASGNQWAPRPIFQSYSAYTPALALANEAHLRSDQAPTNVLMKVESIDSRPATMEDGVSWPTILLDYDPVAVQGQRVIFRQRNRKPVELDKYRLDSRAAYLGKDVALPSGPGAIFARIRAKPTTRGKLSNVLFKSGAMSLHLNLRNGMQRNFRFIPGMAETGFIVSPVIDNTFELALLANNQLSMLEHKAVASLSITADEPARDWQDSLEIELIRLPIPDRQLSIDGFFDTEIAATQDMLALVASTSCEGHLDNVNGAPTNQPATLSGVIEVDGWTALSTAQGQLPEKVFITLTDTQGSTRVYPVRRAARPDVQSYFNNPRLLNAGFVARLDARLLEGQYQLGILRLNKGRFERCQHMEQSITVR